MCAARTIRRQRPARTASWVGFCAALVTLALGSWQAAQRASAAQTGSATATIKVAIKSVTLNTTSLTYGKCTGGYSTGSLLGFPNGTCTTGSVTITNGTAPATILVTGANAVPADGSKPWAICGGPGAPLCSVTTPAADQYSELDGSVQLGLTGACDVSFAATPCGHANPGQATSESLLLNGPASSTDQSPTFSTQITWTAS